MCHKIIHISSGYQIFRKVHIFVIYFPTLFIAACGGIHAAWCSASAPGRYLYTSLPCGWTGILSALPPAGCSPYPETGNLCTRPSPFHTWAAPCPQWCPESTAPHHPSWESSVCLHWSWSISTISFILEVLWSWRSMFSTLFSRSMSRRVSPQNFDM